MSNLSHNTSFSIILPNLQLAWDSVSRGAFKTCPRFYQYVIKDGYTSKLENIHFFFGIGFHSALELYDRERTNGKDHKQSLFSSIRYIIQYTWDFNRKRPWISDEPTKNRETLIRAIIWYLIQFEDDPLETIILEDGNPAVELSFHYNSGYTSITNEPYLLTGHLDRVVNWNDKPWIIDRKAQPKTSKVLGQSGWIQIGDLKEEDSIAGQDGKFHKVKSLYPKGTTEVYKVSFHDRTSVLCAKDHLWTVCKDPNKYWETLSLEKIKLMIEKGRRFHIPVTKPIQHPEVNLIIDPYVLGCLLGNGNFTVNSVIFSTGDAELAKKVGSKLPSFETIKKSPAANFSWTISDIQPQKSAGARVGSTLDSLRKLNLWGKKSRDKFIPYDYLFASETQRHDILQGLLDTDGSWDRGYRRYQTMSTHLAYGVCDLVRSLGGSALLIQRQDGTYRVTIRMPYYEIGANKKYIKEITRVEDDETICIEIDTKSGLYITDNYIVTHNTTKTTLGKDTPKFFNKFSPDDQMSGYYFSGTIIFNQPIGGIIIDAGQTAVNFTKFQRGFCYRTTEQLNEWYIDFGYMLKLAEQYAQDNYYPMNDKSCNNFGGCPFRMVCSESPEMREELLNKFYSKRVWDPLVTREV